MTNLQERPDLRASIMDAYDKWDHQVRRPARRRRMAVVTAGIVFAFGSFWSGIMLFRDRPTEEIAVSLPSPPEPVFPVSAPPPGIEAKPDVPPKSRPSTSTPKSAPVFRGAETARKIRLTPGVQSIQGTDIQMVTGVQKAVEVNFFTVSVAGEVWRIGSTGAQKLKMVSGTNGFILPTDSGPVTILFSSQLTDGKPLFGTKTGTNAAATPSITFSTDRR